MVDIDAGDLQRLGVDLRTRKWNHVGRDHGARKDPAFRIHLDRRGGDLKQGMALGVEAAGLDIDDHGQETTEAFRHGARWERRAHVRTLPGGEKKGLIGREDTSLGSSTCLDGSVARGQGAGPGSSCRRGGEVESWEFICGPRGRMRGRRRSGL